MDRYISPTLLVAVHSFERRTEQIRHLFLGLIEALAVFSKFTFIHYSEFIPPADNKVKQKCYIVVFYVY